MKILKACKLLFKIFSRWGNIAENLCGDTFFCRTLQSCHSPLKINGMLRANIAEETLVTNVDLDVDGLYQPLQSTSLNRTKTLHYY